MGRGMGGKETSIRSTYAKLIAFIFLILLLDQLVKIWVVSTFNLYEQKEILGSFLRFRFIENQGLAFGLGSHFPEWVRHFIFLFLTIVAIGVISYFFWRSRRDKRRVSLFAFALILGGALGNLTDKVFGYMIFHGEWKWIYGRVVDFIDIGIGEYRWPVFNVADISISIGVGLIFFVTYFLKNTDLKKKDEKDLNKSKTFDTKT